MKRSSACDISVRVDVATLAICLSYAGWGPLTISISGDGMNPLTARRLRRPFAVSVDAASTVSSLLEFGRLAPIAHLSTPRHSEAEYASALS